MHRGLSYTLTADATLRKVIIGPGHWRIYGTAVHPTYAAWRRALGDGTGTLQAGEAAPVLADLQAPAAGTPNPATAAWGAGSILASPAATGSASGGFPLPAVATAYEEIRVPPEENAVLWLAAPAGAVTIQLVGPLDAARPYSTIAPE